MAAKRVWKRDGSVNLMDAEVAAQLAQRNAISRDTRRQARNLIAERLEQGEVIETGHAWLMAAWQVPPSNGQAAG